MSSNPILDILKKGTPIVTDSNLNMKYFKLRYEFDNLSTDDILFLIQNLKVGLVIPEMGQGPNKRENVTITFIKNFHLDSLDSSKDTGNHHLRIELSADDE